MKTDFFSIIGLTLAVFFSIGWYFAEADNEILIKENSYLKQQVQSHEN